ncbi:hypothetical protein ACFQ2H_18635 [Streptomyces violaceoruber]
MQVVEGEQLDVLITALAVTMTVPVAAVPAVVPARARRGRQRRRGERPGGDDGGGGDEETARTASATRLVRLCCDWHAPPVGVRGASR